MKKLFYCIISATLMFWLLAACKKSSNTPPPLNIEAWEPFKIDPTHGPKGTRVLVYCTRNFIAEIDSLPIKLFYNGVSIPFDFKNTAFDFNVPAGLGSGPIELELKGGKRLKCPSFTYDSLYYVTTMAGTGIRGNTDGPAATAQFDNPHGIAIDINNNIYVAERYKHRIRKISASGEVTTFAGNGVAGFADGTGTAALFNEPIDVAVDRNGNVFVADGKNRRIRKISPNGETSTYAGSGDWGYNLEGDSTKAVFTPSGIDIDPNGVLYFTSYQQIMKVTTDKKVTVVAGNVNSGDVDGSGINAYFYNPYGVAVAADGNLFISEASNNKIRKVTPQGVVTTFAGGGGFNGGYVNGIGPAARFNSPLGLVFGPDKNLYVVDAPFNEVIRIITPDANVQTFAGRQSYYGFRDTIAANALFYDPVGIASNIKGNLFIADTKNHRIRKIYKE